MMKMKDFSCEELKALAVELPDEVNRYKMAGDFEGAAKAIDRWMDKPVGEAMKTRLLYETYILQKLPKEFPDTEEEAVSYTHLSQQQKEDPGYGLFGL